MVRLCQAALHRPRVLLGHVIFRHWKVQNNTSFLCPKFKTNARTRSCLLWAVPVYTQKKPDEVSRWPLRAERPMLATSFLWHPTNPISCGAVYASRGALQPDRPCPCLSFAVTLVFFSETNINVEQDFPHETRRHQQSVTGANVGHTCVVEHYCSQHISLKAARGV